MNKYLILFLALSLSIGLPCRSQGQQHSFAMSDNSFMLDGKPFQMISGEMHYSRVPREAWRSRMKMAKAMGLNTIGTYVFWNLHEPQKDHFDFTGNSDIAEFVKIAKEEGLWVILRPSPYVCAEWEFGGYPYWLQNETGLVVRSKEEKYIAEYRKYIIQVGKQLAPLQINHGGNILMVQIENEYGSYGADKEYLALNQKLFREAGFDGLLYTCDPASDVAKGHLEGLLPAVNGIDNPTRIKKIVNDNHNGKGPYYVAEWYPAWFDWWGTEHHTVKAEKYIPGLDSVLANGISINMYMFHGGTTRGFMNGANYKDGTPYEPQINSYDYDAPLDEAGNATDKFMKFRQVIKKYLPNGKLLPDVPAVKPSMAISEIKLTQSTSVLNNLPLARHSELPLTFEDLNQAYGYVLYRTHLSGNRAGILKLNELRDYAVVMINGKTVGMLDRRLKQDSLQISLPAGNVTLDILVENLGRINFGKYLLKNKKGITKNVVFNNLEIKNWQMFGLPLNNVSEIRFIGSQSSGNAPAFKKGIFNLKQIADTYLDLSKWGKGVIWVNGHNLGRYWNIGPQQTIYLPAEWLKKGNNSIVVFELLKSGQSKLSALAKPILNQLQ